MRQTSCLRDFIRYATLNVLGMLGLSCYILADTFFIAKGLGADGLAALNLALPVYSLVHGCGLMAGMGGGIRFSILRGQGRQDAVDSVFTHAASFVLLLAALFVVLGLTCPDLIAGALGAEGQIRGMSRTYLRVILLFSPLFLSNELLLCFVRNDGAPQLTMAAMLSGSLSNILLDYVFIFPLDMGIFGAVLATGIAPAVSLLIMLPFFLKKRNHFHLRGCPLGLPLLRRDLADIFSGGLPSLIAEVSSGIVILVFNMIILRLEGNVGVAAYGVIANLSLVVIAVYTGIAQGIQPLISGAYGKNMYGDIRLLLRYAISALAVLSAGIYAGIFFGAEWIAGVFNSGADPLLQRIAVRGLLIYFTGCAAAGFNIILSACFTSTEHGRPAHILSLLRGSVLIIPMAFSLAFCWGMTGVWLAFPATETIVCLLGIVCLFLQKAQVP